MRVKSELASQNDMEIDWNSVIGICTQSTGLEKKKTRGTFGPKDLCERRRFVCYFTLL